LKKKFIKITINWVCKEKYEREKLGNHCDVRQSITAQKINNYNNQLMLGMALLLEEKI